MGGGGGVLQMGGKNRVRARATTDLIKGLHPVPSGLVKFIMPSISTS